MLNREGQVSPHNPEEPKPTPNLSLDASLLGAQLTVEGLGHSYGAKAVLHEVDFQVDAGEVVALLGPSGCGKTTILRLIAGFMRQSYGRVLMEGTAIDDVPSNRRNMGLVFQNYALFPHLTVRENIGYGLVAQGKKRHQVRDRVDEILDLTRLAEFAGNLPRDLSGGQQQRVATGRALAVRPRLMLLDEPFGALDKNLRFDMQIEFLRIQRKFGISSIIVTHDQEEAFCLANRVIVLNGGRIEQIGTPETIYDRPATLFVNGFVGGTNKIDCKIAEVGPSSATIHLPGAETVNVNGRVAAPEGTQAVLTVRPEHLQVSSTSSPGSLAGVVDAVLPVGPTLTYEVLLTDGTPIKVSQSRKPGDRVLAQGTDVFVVIPEKEYQVFVNGVRAFDP